MDLEFNTIDLKSKSENGKPSSSGALSFIATALDERIQLRLDENSDRIVEPTTVVEFFNNTVESYGNHPAIAYQTSQQQWSTINYNEYKDNVQQVAKAFIKLGLEPRTSVSVLAFNCPEWFYSQFAALYAGGVVTGIYTTSSPDAIYHVLSTSDSRICIVDNAQQMDKVRSIRHRLPKLKAIIQIHGPFSNEYMSKESGLYQWSDIELMDTRDYSDELELRLKNCVPNEVAMIIYTSGTVGLPKGVLLSHDNLVWAIKAVIPQLQSITYGDERIVSYLPLNHIAAQIFDIFLPVEIGACVYFADRNAMKGTLVKTLIVARPTRFVGVPRVLEKFYEKLVTIESTNGSRLSKLLLNRAKSFIYSYYLSGGSFLLYWLGEKVMRKVKAAMGFDDCRQFLVGGAPVSLDIKEFFLSYDMGLYEIYGMSETTGAIAITTDFKNILSAGKVLPELEVKISHDENDKFGEIWVRGRSNFMGYLNDIEKTNACLTPDGWIRTGDIGYLDNDKNLTITGRLKELVITSGGENIPPVHVEDLIKHELPALSNVVLIGDKKKFLTVLLTIKTEIDSEKGVPLDKLLPEAIEWIKSLGLEYTKLSEILDAGPCPIVLQAIQNGIERANLNALSQAQKVQKFAILQADFSLPGGEIGPTLKVKRSFVHEKYVDVINGLYEGV